METCYIVGTSLYPLIDRRAVDSRIPRAEHAYGFCRHIRSAIDHNGYHTIVSAPKYPSNKIHVLPKEF